VGAVHERLLPGRVSDAHIDGDSRTLVYPDGQTVRELIVDIDDEARRLAYAVVEGARGVTYHHATFQVFGEGERRSRLVWITDILPHTSAAGARARIERGAQEMKETLEKAGP
jgi:hypothetical protein